MFGSGAYLGTYLQAKGDAARSELSRLDADYLLTENEDVLIAALLEKHAPGEVVVHWDAATRTPVSETSMNVRDPFFQEKIYNVPASRVTLTFPISGDASVLNYQATTHSWAPEQGTIGNGAVQLEIVKRELNPNEIKTAVEELRRDIDQRVQWANADIRGLRTSLEQTLRGDYRQRKQRILNDRSVEDALGIPIKTTDQPRLPVAAQRKHVTLEVRKSQAGFVPEPVLDERDYRDILDQTKAWARGLERTPGTLSNLGEEQLRDLLLATLNGFWKGAAGGELFNGAGKTDVLIRQDNRNVFIGECKVWSGAKGVGEAIDQLLSYLVWRDSKAALIYFVRAARPDEIIRKLHEAVEAHPRCVLTQPNGRPGEQVDYIFTADDEGRRISLAVIPVVQQPIQQS